MSDRVKILATRILSKGWASLTQTTLELLRRDGTWQSMDRESYDHGHAACILLLDPVGNTVMLTRQFRYPVYASGDNAWLIEACAGLLDDDDPQTAIIREALEETGYRPDNVQHLFDAYMSPGSVTEKVSFFVGTYSPGVKQAEGGGLRDEGEDIEGLELPFKQALAMIGSGDIIDGKTIALLQWVALNRPEMLA